MRKVNSDKGKVIYAEGVYEVDKNSSGGVTPTVPGGTPPPNTTMKSLYAAANFSSSYLGEAGGGGETRFSIGAMYTDKLFTGQRDTGLGIYYYNARFYSQKLGRFISPTRLFQVILIHRT